MLDFDSIVIGGGPAGAAFALELSRHGLKTAIVERTRAAHQKVCGDFHSREAQQLLATWGIDLARLGALTIDTFRLASGRRSATAPLPFAAAGFSRLALDEALLTAAQEAGAVLLRGESASSLETAPDHVAVRIGKRVLRARCAALATGKHNLRGWARAHGVLTAFKMQLDPAPAAARQLRGAVQLVGYRGGYIGACVVDGGALSICWLADRRFMSETNGDWRCQLAWISAQSAYVGDLIAGGRFHSDQPAAISAVPFGYMRHGLIGDNVYPVGDQLAVIPSVTGDGTSLALSSGKRAARAVLAGIGAGNYQRETLARLRSQFRWARLTHATFACGVLRTLGVGAVAALPRIASRLCERTRTRDIGELLCA